jgi:hypothetical protein
MGEDERTKEIRDNESGHSKDSKDTRRINSNG